MRMVRLGTVGLLGLLLGLRCNARNSLFHSQGLKWSCFELSVVNLECSVLTAFQLVHSDWSQLGLPSWGSVVDYAKLKGPIDLKELIFPPAPPFEKSEASTRQLSEALKTTAAKCSKRKGPCQW